jgi:predicted nucleotidyltransferase
MTMQPPDDPVLKRYRAVLDDMYGTQIERVILFDSHARGDARLDSDYDIALFLKSLPDRWAGQHRLADLRVIFLDDADAFFDTKLYPATAWFERTPLMREIRRDGLTL